MVKVRRLYPFDDWVYLDMAEVLVIMPVDAGCMKVKFKDGHTEQVDAITFE